MEKTMNARKTLLAGLLAASGLMLAVPAVQAQPYGGYGPGMGMGMGMGPGGQGGYGPMHGMRGGGRGFGELGEMRGLWRLDLTDAQRDQMFKIRHEAAPALREKMEAARKARLELRQIAGSQNYDSARARQLADTQAKAMADATFLRTEMMNKIVAVLTPEQRTKLNELRDQRGPWGGPRGPRS
jgi:Spy/CpxP family protein refolding chaperone